MLENKKIYLLKFLGVFLILLCLFEFVEFIIDTNEQMEMYNNINFFSKTNLILILKILHSFVLMFAELTGANICLKLSSNINIDDSDEETSVLQLKSDYAFLSAYWIILVVAFVVFMGIQIPPMFKIDFSIIFFFLFVFGLYKTIKHKFEKRHNKRHR